MNRLERFYRIHELLRQARRPVPMSRFCEALGSTRNTITRDFQYLKDMFGAPIVYDRERNGHCYDATEPVFELPGLWMNATELHALLVCEQLLESVQPGLMAARLEPLKTRIRQLLAEAGQAEASVSERVRVQPVHSRRVNDTIFIPVADAVLARWQLRFSYRSRGRDDLSRRQVDPQQLLHYRHNWYLLAHCQGSKALRLFSLDRISQPERLDMLAADTSPEQMNAFADASFGIFSGVATAEAHLRFSALAARWVADEHWHPRQRGEWLADGYHLYVPYSDPTELIMDILRHGSEVEIVGPAVLRGAVAAKIESMRKIYWH